MTKRVLEEASKAHNTVITDFYVEIQENCVDVAGGKNALTSNYLDQDIKIISTIKREPTVKFIFIHSLQGIGPPGL